MSSFLDASIFLTPLAKSIQEFASAAKRANDEAKVKGKKIYWNFMNTKGERYSKLSFSYKLMLWHLPFWSADTDGARIY